MTRWNQFASAAGSVLVALFIAVAAFSFMDAV